MKKALPSAISLLSGKSRTFKDLLHPSVNLLATCARLDQRNRRLLSLKDRSVNLLLILRRLSLHDSSCHVSPKSVSHMLGVDVADHRLPRSYRATAHIMGVTALIPGSDDEISQLETLVEQE